MKSTREKLKEIAIGLSSLVFMWLVWFIAHKTVKNEYLIPSLEETLSSMVYLFKEAFFYRALGKTLLKVLYSFLISFVNASVFSFTGKVFKPLRAFLKPIISVIRTLPTMAILVLILIYTNSSTAPIIVATLVLFPMIYAQMNVALDSIDQNIIDATKVQKIGKKDWIMKVYFPMILPSVLSHTGSNLSFSVKLVISAEVMAYTFTSLGGLMQSANALMDIPRLMALTLVAIVIGLLIELVFALINRFTFKWAKNKE